MATASTGALLRLASFPTSTTLSVVRWSIVIAFAWAGGSKLLLPEYTRLALLETGMVPASLLRPLMFGLPIMEIILATALAARFALPVTCLATGFLSLVFSGMHALLLASGTVKPCGCAGVALDFGGAGWHVAFLLISVGMFAASMSLLSFSPRDLSKS